MSFFLTTEQIRNRTKTVTRRICWATLKPGERFRAVRKAQGLKKGEKVEVLAVLECVSNTRERVQDISEADAIAEGFSRDHCEAVFATLNDRVAMEYERWFVEDESGQCSDESFCPRCAEKQIQKPKWKGWSIDGWDDAHETDSPKWCDACGVLLRFSLTREGVEIQLTPDVDFLPVVPGDDAQINYDIACGYHDFRTEHDGKLARVAFATVWNRHWKNGVNGWKANPWVNRIEFKYVE